jgi:hypothetical protein
VSKKLVVRQDTELNMLDKDDDNITNFKYSTTVIPNAEENKSSTIVPSVGKSKLINKRIKVGSPENTGNILSLKRESDSTKRDTGTNEDNRNPNETPNPIRDQTPSQMTSKKSPSPEETKETEEQTKENKDPYAFEKISKFMTEYEQKEVLSFKKVHFFNTLERRLNMDAFNPTGKHNHGYDNEQGEYIFVKHDHINYRFEIMRQLGKGSFGVVLK